MARNTLRYAGQYQDDESGRTKLNADHPVDLIVGGSPTQILQMLNESINKSVGSSLKNAGRKAGLQPGDRISEIIFQ
ncbi:RHS repeat-associated core domain-containing protein [Serratia ficaria]|uniref:hypothetical protein n=1 Tax=Serratia ficaria TaxID=61651 RepID=UPI0021BB705B|nr:hypothetical protein [Serratia ficaria]